MKHTIVKNLGGETKTVSLNPLKAIRATCLECVCWSPKEVKLCPSTLCALYPYRCGTNPGRKGIGDSSNLRKKGS